MLPYRYFRRSRAPPAEARQRSAPAPLAHIFAPPLFFPGDAPAFHRTGSRYFSLARTSAMRHWCCASADSRSHACAIACAGESAVRGALDAVCTRGGFGRCGCVGDGGSDGICARTRASSVEGRVERRTAGGAYNVHEGVINMG